MPSQIGLVFEMKRIPALLLLAIIPAATQTADAQNIEKTLSAHIEVESQTYCHVDDEAFTASIHLKASLTNISDQTVILARKIEPPLVIRVARDAETAKRNELLYAPDVMLGPVSKAPPAAPAFGKAPNPKLFVLLPPGASFETVVQSGVVAANVTSRPQAGLLANGGSYFIQVGISTWPYDYPFFTAKTTPSELKRRWSNFGNLSTGMVYSDFAPFTLPEHFDNPRCK